MEAMRGIVALQMSLTSKNSTLSKTHALESIQSIEALAQLETALYVGTSDGFTPSSSDNIGYDEVQ
jgi:hypothetical protein